MKMCKASPESSQLAKRTSPDAPGKVVYGWTSRPIVSNMAQKKVKVWGIAWLICPQAVRKCKWRSVGEAVEELENESNSIKSRVSRGRRRPQCDGKNFWLLREKQAVRSRVVGRKRKMCSVAFERIHPPQYKGKI